MKALPLKKKLIPAIAVLLALALYWFQSSPPEDAPAPEFMGASGGENKSEYHSDLDISEGALGTGQLGTEYVWHSGQPVPEPIYREDDPARILSPVERMVRDAMTVERRELVADADGGPGWLRLVHAPDFKYPWLRVVERFTVGKDGGLDLFPSVEVAVADHILARFPDDLSADEVARRVAASGGEVLRHSLLPGLVLVSLAEVTLDGVPEMITRLAASGAVAYAEPDFVVGHLGGRVPNDPDYHRLWGMPVVSAPQAWEVTTGSRDIIVAVIDTGVDYRHEDLAANIWRNPREVVNSADSDGNGFIDDFRGWNFNGSNNDPFDDNGHGTHVAGTIGAVGNNAVGITGAAWEVSIMALKTFSAQGSGATSDNIDAIRYAVLNGANVINASWGGSAFSQALYDAIAEARDARVVFVAAAGNSNGRTPVFPAFYGHLEEDPLRNVISVGAIHFVPGPDGPEERKASFSEWGAFIGAPGVAIHSTIPGSSYASYSGTSMAAPLVAGTASLMLALGPDTDAEDIVFWLIESADTVPTLAATVINAARLNMAAAVFANTSDPIMSLFDFTFIDLDGPRAGNGVVNPGETVELTATVGVRGPNPASNVTARVTTEDPDVTLISDFIELGNFEPSERRVFPSPLVFSVAPDARTPRDLLFDLIMEDDEGRSWQSVVEVPLFTSFDISGIVRAMDGSPLANATITVGGDRNFTTVTDAAGRYTVELTEGNYTLLAEVEGMLAPVIRRFEVPVAAEEIHFVLGSATLETLTPSVTATLRPGERKRVEVVLANNGTAPLDYEVRPMSYAFESFPNALNTQDDPDFAWLEITEQAVLLDLFETWYPQEVRFADGTGAGVFNEAPYFMMSPVEIGFPFPFYGERFETLRINNSGWLSFSGYNRSASTLSGQPAVLPNPARAENKIAFAWNNPSERGNASPSAWTTWGDETAAQTLHYDRIDEHTFVFNWNRWPSWVHPLLFRQYLSGQVVLKSDGTIIIKYKSYEAQPGHNLRDEQPRTYVVGLQDGTNTRGMTVVYGQQPYAIRPGTVFRFRPDFGAPWLETSPGVGRIPAFGSQRTLELTLDASYLPEGQFTTRLVVDNNGTDGPVIIPVQLRVDAMAPASPDPDPQGGEAFAVRIEGREFSAQPTVVSVNRAIVDRADLPVVDFSHGEFETWGPVDRDLTRTVGFADGAGVRISREGFTSYPFSYDITENTVIEFEYRNVYDTYTVGRGTVHGIGLANGPDLVPQRIFQLFGDRRDWGSNLNYRDYPITIPGAARSSEWQRFRIPVGRYYTGAVDRLVFVQHARAARGLELLDPDNLYRNLRIFEAQEGAELEFQWTIEDGEATDIMTGEAITRTFVTPGEKVLRVLATEGQLTGSASRIIPVAGEPRFRFRINFQPEGILTPGGFLPDTGRVFGDRENGLHYGWNVDSRAQMRRDPWFISSVNAESDTLAFFGTSRIWEMAVPDGIYRVTVQSGSGAFSGSHLIYAEGELVLNATTTVNMTSYATGTRTVPVSDGRLTLTSGRNATTINFIEIERIADLNLTAPIADFSLSPQSGDAPLTVTFDSAAAFDGDGTIVRRDWSFGDGFTAVGVAPTHTFLLPGRYEVTLTVTDNDGLQSTVDRTVVVEGAPSPRVVITPPPQGAEISSGSAPLTYTVRLSDLPAGAVSVSLAADPDSVAVWPATLDFTAENYAVEQVVTVSAPVSPQWPFGISGAPVSHTVISTDPVYNGIAVPDVVITIDGPQAPFAPVIVQHPESVSVLEGTTVVFSADAIANPDVEWLWFHNDQPLVHATQSQLTITDSTASDAGIYRARAANSLGEVFTRDASLVVRDVPTARALSIAFEGYTGEETLEDFPVLVRLHEGLAGFGYNTFADSQDGSDLRFYADDLVTVIPHEIEVWNPEGVSTVWVRLPELRPGGSTIVATWGQLLAPAHDTRQVWSNHYRLVYHFGDTDGMIRDSGPSARDGQIINPVGSVPAAGVTGFAYDFSGDMIDTGSAAADLGIDGALPRTVSFWLNHRGVDAGGAFTLGEASGNGRWSLRPRGKNNLMVDRWSLDMHGTQQDFTFTTADTWVHFAVVYDGSHARVYANGQVIDASVRSIQLATAATGNLLLGAFETSVLDGLIDAFRVAAIARSPDWIRAEYEVAAPDSSFARYDVLNNGAEAPVVVGQPLSRTVATGTTVSFEVAVATMGDSGFLYEWFHGDTLLPSAVGPSLEIANVTAANNGSYRVRITNAAGATWSREAVLTVLDVPRILIQPQDQTVNTGQTAAFSVTADGGEPLRYQWYRNDEMMPGAVSRELSVPAVLYHDALYRVRVTNEVGTVLSDNAALHVVSAPVILTEPRDASVIEGLPYAFSVEVDAMPVPTYQWYHNGRALPGETGPALHFPGVLPAMAGEYFVVIRNNRGTTTSRTAVLTTRDMPETPSLRIAFPGYEGDSILYDFPVLIRLNQQIQGFRYLQFADRNHGSDLRFYHASIEGELAYEFDYWNDIGQTAVWVRVPEISPHGTEIIATWGDPENVRDVADGNPTDVWENGYKLVYHMSGTGTHVPDATAGGRNGIVRDPAGARWVRGIVGMAYDYTTDYMDIPHARALDIEGARSRTVSFWAYTRRFNDSGVFQFGVTNLRSMWAFRTGSTDNRWLLDLESGTGNPEFFFEGLNRWVHFTAVYDGQEARVYADGELIEEATARVGLQTSMFNARIGIYQLQRHYNFDGLIDEFRVANVARHADWIRAEWATVADHATFTRYAPLQRFDASAPVIVSQPINTWVNPAAAAELTVVATTPPGATVAYQWFHNNQPIAGGLGICRQNAALDISSGNLCH